MVSHLNDLLGSQPQCDQTFPVTASTFEKDSEIHVEGLNEPGAGGTKSATKDGFRVAAIAAEGTEQSLTVLQSFKIYRKAVWWSLVMSLVIIMEGYDSALMGNLYGQESFRQRYGEYTGVENGWQLKPSAQAALGQAANIGVVIGTFLSAYIIERMGYRGCTQVSLVAVAGFIFIVFFAPTWPVLFVGQFLLGMPWGMFICSAVAYSSEVCPISLRGYLTSYVNLCFIIGQIITSGVMIPLNKINNQWSFKIPFAIQWVWPVPLFILVTLAPESPWYLVRKGRLEEAEKSVRRLASTDGDVNPSDVIAMMVRTNQMEIDQGTGTRYIDCFKHKNLRRTHISSITWASQQLCGISFSGQGAYFFEQAGLSADHAYQLSLGTTALGFCGQFCSWFSITYFGRRKVLLCGLSFGTFLYLMVGIVSFYNDRFHNLDWAIAALLMIWTFNFDFAIGPVSYTVAPEVTSTRLRSRSMGIARNVSAVIQIGSGILNTYQVNPSAWGWVGKAGLFWAGMSLLTTIWVYFYLPETKGRSYREIDLLFERGIPARKFKETIVEAEAEE